MLSFVLYDRMNNAHLDVISFCENSDQFVRFIVKNQGHVHFAIGDPFHNIGHKIRSFGRIKTIFSIGILQDSTNAASKTVSFRSEDTFLSKRNDILRINIGSHTQLRLSAGNLGGLTKKRRRRG